ncbi:helix-turn-helix domain-containing protein [Streptomyces chumphonensis]|uniref:helix-turn-helix domain-containing protein n=1 Tax=Streptomyces chumphonensis TaxID=1214925 RepID=UPI003D73A853
MPTEPTPTRDARDAASRAAPRFGRYILQAAREAGYDVDSQRGGGRKALADAVGIHSSNIGRMLDGKSIPDVRHFERLAAAVRRPLRELFVEAEIISATSLTEPDTSRVASFTPERAADELGIYDPDDRALFLGMAARLRPTDPSSKNAAEPHPGEAAEG